MDYKIQLSYKQEIEKILVEFASNYLLSYNTKIAFDWSRDPKATC